MSGDNVIRLFLLAFSVLIGLGCLAAAEDSYGTGEGKA